MNSNSASSGSVTAQSTDDTDRSCPGCGNTPDRSHKVGEWTEDNPSGVYRCNVAGCRVERFFLPDWSMGSDGVRRLGDYLGTSYRPGDHND